MSLLKKIAGETAIYGLSSIVGRAVNFLLVPLYTAVLPAGEYGIVTELYAIVAFLMVLMVYRFETAYFRYAHSDEGEGKTFSTAMTSLVLSTILLAAVMALAAPTMAGWLDYRSGDLVYFYLFIGIVSLDVLAEIPMARLRLQSKAMRFAAVRLTNIGINIGLNLFFLLLCPYLLSLDGFSRIHPFLETIYNPDRKILYIFLSNLVASLVQLILLLPEVRRSRWSIDRALWVRMFRYSAPLVIVGFAGIVNEMLDRVLLKQLLPFDLETNERELGIYGACYKLSILMALFTQAYRYAVEPFFFRHADRKESPALYGAIAKYFVIIGALGFLVITLYIDYFKLFLQDPEYWEGLAVVPILLMANLFLGLYYNLSVWYKLTDRTVYATYISVGGALITLALNLYWIPRIGYTGSAWATLICYLAMTIASYWIGKRFYPFRYNLGRMALYIGVPLLLYLLSRQMIGVWEGSRWQRDLFHLLMVSLFLALVYWLERKEVRKWISVG